MLLITQTSPSYPKSVTLLTLRIFLHTCLKVTIYPTQLLLLSLLFFLLLYTSTIPYFSTSSFVFYFPSQPISTSNPPYLCFPLIFWWTALINIRAVIWTPVLTWYYSCTNLILPYFFCIYLFLISPSLIFQTPLFLIVPLLLFPTLDTRYVMSTPPIASSPLPTPRLYFLGSLPRSLLGHILRLGMALKASGMTSAETVMLMSAILWAPSGHSLWRLV